jgi:protein MAK16
MQADPVIWEVINKQFCSFKVVLRDQKGRFCRNEYNVTGLCNRASCPLANSRYATVREENGVIYLYIKTIERAHSPKNLWEKIELHHTYTGALNQIDEHLMHWPASQVHRVKQRLTRLHQYLIRMKKLLAKPSLRVTPIKKKYLRREDAREKKALVAAKLDFAIKKELLERLKNKVYGGLYNFSEKVFNEVMDEEGNNEVTYVEASDELEGELENDLSNELDQESYEESDDDDGAMDMEDSNENFARIKDNFSSADIKKRKRDSAIKASNKRKNTAAKVEIEYEHEQDMQPTTSR